MNKGEKIQTAEKIIDPRADFWAIYSWGYSGMGNKELQVNKLCRRCQKQCKQLEWVTVVHCPNFKAKPATERHQAAQDRMK